jgi:hypothetical protein
MVRNRAANVQGLEPLARLKHLQRRTARRGAGKVPGRLADM